MTTDKEGIADANGAPDLDHHSDARFLDYYRTKSASDETLARSRAMHELIISVRRSRGLGTEKLDVADIGCGPGAQSMYWAERGARVCGLDVNADFIELARQRADASGFDIDFRVGTAAELPWPDESVDVCLAPELLEHVPEWEDCLNEFSRILKPGGVLYINTSNRLCPIQNEFNLPLYGWYPQRMKRHFERLAVTTKPELANYATYPAVNWFTFYQLRREFRQRDMDALDRLDLLAAKRKGANGLKDMIVRIARSTSVSRLMIQIATPYTLAVGVKHVDRT